MSNGKPIDFVTAQKRVRDFATRELPRVRQARPLRTEKELVVGHFFDLNAIRRFLFEIDSHNDLNPGAINGITIYGAVSSEMGQKEDDTDLVLVASKDRKDIFGVYEGHKANEPNPLILGDGLPCPNVCKPGEGGLICP